MNKKLIAANWKMNPTSSSEAASLFSQTGAHARSHKDVETAICAPFLYIPALSRARGQYPDVELGAQDAFWKESGAYTGEVSPSMLDEFNIRYVIIGHSERRRYMDEGNEMVGKKVAAVIGAGLVPIVCVGESSREDKSWEEVKNFVKDQIDGALAGLSELEEGLNSRGIVFAYEPVWAISTMGGGPDTPESARKMIETIRSYIGEKLSFLSENSLRVIYGGSLNSDNADDFLKHPEIEGGLIGGASLKAESFGKIIKIASQYSGKQ